MTGRAGSACHQRRQPSSTKLELSAGLRGNTQCHARGSSLVWAWKSTSPPTRKKFHAGAQTPSILRQRAKLIRMAATLLWMIRPTARVIGFDIRSVMEKITLVVEVIRILLLSAWQRNLGPENKLSTRARLRVRLATEQRGSMGIRSTGRPPIKCLSSLRRSSCSDRHSECLPHFTLKFYL
jgi:hypothetical protein